MSKLTNLPAVPVAKKHDSLTEEERIMTSHYAEQFDEPIRTMVDIHTYCRPHNSATIDEFVEKFLEVRFAHLQPYYLNGVHATTQETQPYALVIEVDDTSRTLFSAHVDTVHSYSGRQIVDYDKDMAILMKPTAKREQFGDCLGADDGAGVWLLIQMIEAGVPGVYHFPYGEERGGVGSSGIADDHPDFLKRFDRAIAFDRKGTTDIITHQAAGRCCSDAFAKELASRLNQTGNKLSMAPDNGGIFTDTANYTHIIAECSNVSCGYEGAHSSGEFLDVEFLMKLRDACLQIVWEDLPIERDPKVIDPIDDWGYGPYKFPKYEPKVRSNTTTHWGIEAEVEDIMGMGFGQMIQWAKGADAETIAEVMFELIDRVYQAEDALYAQEDDDQFDQMYRDHMGDDDDRTSHN